MNDQSKKLLPLLQMDLSELWRESAKPLTREIIGERIDAFMQIPSYSSADKDWLLTQLEALFTIWAPRTEF